MWLAKAVEDGADLEERAKFLAIQEEQDKEQLVHHRQHGRRWWRASGVQYTLVITIIVLLVVDILCRVYFTNSECLSGVQERSPYLLGNGTTSELATAREVMTYSTRNLTGLYEYSTATKRLTRTKDAKVEYFGPPSPELDAAWEDLLRHPLNILLEHEIKPSMHVRDKDRWAQDKKIHFEPEVYHVLHCLNAVRKSVNRAIYPEVKIPAKVLEAERLQLHEVTDDWHRLHIEHCLDRIRQDIMCHADMTPSTFYGLDSLPVSLLLGKHSERVCRDWEPVRKWTAGREAIGNKEIEMEKASKEVKIP